MKTVCEPLLIAWDHIQDGLLAKEEGRASASKTSALASQDVFAPSGHALEPDFETWSYSPIGVTRAACTAC